MSWQAGGGWGKEGLAERSGERRAKGLPRHAPPVGTQNLNGQSVFSVVPVEGVLDPGAAQDFTVTFSPDHESLYFSDRLQVLLFEKVHLPCMRPASPLLPCTCLSP